MTTYAHAKPKTHTKTGLVFDTFMLLLPSLTLGACMVWVFFPFGGF